MKPLLKNKRALLYLFPNLFTTFNLFLGFFSVIAAFGGKWEIASFSILLAAITDGIDGRVARMTKTESEFGEQYDSLADLMSFGVAPSTLLYTWGLMQYGKLGWIVAFGFLACAALRLARFNVNKQTVEKRYFQGCPSPVAACTMASAVLFYDYLNLPDSRDIYILIVMSFLALAMVSNLRYRSFKDLKLKTQKGFAYIMLATVVFVLMLRKPEQGLFPGFILYLLSAPLRSVVSYLFNKNEDDLI